jgi:hypothetical protein
MILYLSEKHRRMITIEVCKATEAIFAMHGDS